MFNFNLLPVFQSYMFTLRDFHRHLLSSDNDSSTSTCFSIYCTPIMLFDHFHFIHFGSRPIATSETLLLKLCSYLCLVGRTSGGGWIWRNTKWYTEICWADVQPSLVTNLSIAFLSMLAGRTSAYAALMCGCSYFIFLRFFFLVFPGYWGMDRSTFFGFHSFSLPRP
jgi:hypothetical protein